VVRQFLEHKKMEALEGKLKDLKITKDELFRVTEALKNEEFRKQMLEYVEEVKNPANRRQYQAEMVKLEMERGIECKFINPTAGFVVKTSVDGEKKAFINICANDLIDKPSCKPTQESSSRGLKWAIPFSPSPSRDDVDKKKQRCLVYDVVFHTDTLRMADKSPSFKKIVIETALEGIEDSFLAKLDQKNYTILSMKYKGTPTPTVIRKMIDDPPKLSEEEAEFHQKLNYPSKETLTGKKKPIVKTIRVKDSSNYTVPKYTIKYRMGVDLQDHTLGKYSKLNAAIPKELVIDIKLPLIRGVRDVKLNISEKLLDLECEKPAKYRLALGLPYTVDPKPCYGRAKFDVQKKILSIVLPVNHPVPTPEVKEYIREDSGVESDAGDVALSEPINPPMHFEGPAKADPFLDPNQHYNFPNFDCSRQGNRLFFVFNVKNVDPKSMKMKDWGMGFHIKFSSIGSGYFPINYAFYADFPSEMTELVKVEFWDNNVTAETALSTYDDGELCVFNFYQILSRCLKKLSWVRSSKIIHRLALT